MATKEWPKWRLRQSDEFIHCPPKTPVLQALSLGIWASILICILCFYSLLRCKSASAICSSSSSISSCDENHTKTQCNKKLCKISKCWLLTLFTGKLSIIWTTSWNPNPEYYLKDYYLLLLYYLLDTVINSLIIPYVLLCKIQVIFLYHFKASQVDGLDTHHNTTWKYFDIFHAVLCIPFFYIWSCILLFFRGRL